MFFSLAWKCLFSRQRSQRTKALQWKIGTWLVQQFKTMTLESGEMGGSNQLGLPGTSELQSKFLDDTAWSGAHHNDAIRKKQGFIDIMRDKYDGGPDTLPYTQQ
jgi:hypothetical protein